MNELNVPFYLTNNHKSSFIMPLSVFLNILLLGDKFSWMHELTVGKKSHAKITESCFRHPLFDLPGTRKVEIRHTNFHFSSKKVTSKSRKVEVFDLTNVKKLSTFRPKKAKVEKLKSRKVES